MRYFQKGKPTFNCSVCGKLTRNTTDSNVDMCQECYEEAEAENEVMDHEF